MADHLGGIHALVTVIRHPTNKLFTRLLERPRGQSSPGVDTARKIVWGVGQRLARMPG